MKRFVKRSLLWLAGKIKEFVKQSSLCLVQLCDKILPDGFAKRLFGAKIFFYTLGGAFVGGAAQSGFETVAGFWSTIDTTFKPDIVAVILVGWAGFLFAQIGGQVEMLGEDVDKRGDKGDLTPEDLLRFRREQEEKRYPNVKWRFLLASVLLVAVLPVLLIGHRPPATLKHLAIHLGCNPCNINAGESSRLSWDTDDATEAFLDDNAVPIKGYRIVRPEQSATYHLRAVNPDGEAKVAVIVEVQEPPTPTPKPSPSPTPSDVSEPTPTGEATALERFCHKLVR